LFARLDRPGSDSRDVPQARVEERTEEVLARIAARCGPGRFLLVIDKSGSMAEPDFPRTKKQTQ